MKVQRLITLSILFVLISSSAYTQEDKSLQKIFRTDGYVLDRNQVRYNPSKDLLFNTDSLRKNEFYLECLHAKEFKGVWESYSKYFLSRDSNFVVYAAIPGIFCKRNDSIYADFELRPEDKMEMNTYHLNHIKVDFLRNSGKRDISLTELPLTYKSSEYARNSFNADTVITYSLKMWHKYENKYTHCLVIMLQKRYRGCIPLYCLYTDDGAKKLDYYLKSLEKIFWYRDPKDYIKVIDPVPETHEYILPKKESDPYVVRIIGCL